MLENVTMMTKSINETNLAILEALIFLQKNPVINKQVKEFLRTLSIF